MPHGQLATGFWMLALAPLLFALGRFSGVPRGKVFALAGNFVSLAAMVIPVRGISVAQSSFDERNNLLSHRVLQRIATEVDIRDWRIDFRDRVFDNKFWGMNASYRGEELLQPTSTTAVPRNSSSCCWDMCRISGQ